MNKTISIRTLIFWAAIAVAVIMFVRQCKGFFAPKTEVIKSDTVWIVAKSDTVYQPVPFTITNTRTNTVYKPFYRTDTLEISEVLPADTPAIIARFYQKAFYSDTVSRNDTTLRKYGTVVVNDTVYQNRITSRRVLTNLKIPEVTNTVVRNRRVVYFDVNVVGTPSEPLYAVGGGFSMKNLNDRIYSVGAFSNKEGQVYYIAGFKIPIRLRLLPFQ